MTGTIQRTLFHVLSSVVILRRKKLYATKFILPDSSREEPEQPLQGERGQQLPKQKKLELLNKRGTKYSHHLHGGVQTYDSEPWILDLWGDSFERDGSKV